MLSVQKKVGITMGSSALLVASVNTLHLALIQQLHLRSALFGPYVGVLLAASVVPFLTALRDGWVGKAVQVLTLLGLGLVATTINPPGDLTGIVLVAFALVLGAQYELLGVRFGPRLIAAVILYGVFALVSAEFRLQRPLLSAANTLIAAGGFLYLFWVVFAEEVQHRRRSERRLQESELRFQQVIRNSNMMATSQDRDLRYTWIYNPHDYLQSRRVMGTGDEELYTRDEASHLRTLKERVLESGSGVQEEFHARIGGQIRHFDLSIQPIADERGTIVGVATTSRDITERVVLREHLIQSERFAAAGQLATYIAHEINSPLQGIASMLDYVRKTYSSQADLRESLDLVNDAFASIRGTVRKLLDLNRPAAAHPESVDLNEIIRNTFALAAGMLKQSEIALTMELTDERVQVLGIPQELTQLLLNLVNNSVEAMRRDDGESLTAERRGRRISVASHLRGDRIVVRYCDTGPGFTEERLQHLFDPFHSGKSPIGMGIGLAICLQIVQSIGGTIDGENAPSGGACFTIVLPAA